MVYWGLSSLLLRVCEFSMWLIKALQKHHFFSNTKLRHVFKILEVAFIHTIFDAVFNNYIINIADYVFFNQLNVFKQCFAILVCYICLMLNQNLSIRFKVKLHTFIIATECFKGNVEFMTSFVNFYDFHSFCFCIKLWTIKCY